MLCVPLFHGQKNKMTKKKIAASLRKTKWNTHSIAVLKNVSCYNLHVKEFLRLTEDSVMVFTA